jgi:hypothetical protein
MADRSDNDSQTSARTRGSAVPPRRLEVPNPAGGPPRQVNCANDQFTTDGVTPAIREFGMLHEILHTMGFVDPKALHHHDGGIQAIIRRICCTAAHSIGVQVPSTPAVTTISGQGVPTSLTLAAASSWTLYHRTPNPRPAGNPPLQRR